MNAWWNWWSDRRDADYDLGNGHVAWNTTVDQESPGGLIIGHADGCLSAVLFDLPGVGPQHRAGRDVWTLVSLDPLHIEPSVLRQGAKNDTDHNHHGFIHKGRWEPCGDDLGPLGG